jgi:hypothetical protein
VLNHKYTGENALRASGLAYSIIRPTGLTNETEGGPFLLEAHQGKQDVFFVFLSFFGMGGWVGGDSS